MIRTIKNIILTRVLCKDTPSIYLGLGSSFEGQWIPEYFNYIGMPTIKVGYNLHNTPQLKGKTKYVFAKAPITGTVVYVKNALKTADDL